MTCLPTLAESNGNSMEEYTVKKCLLTGFLAEACGGDIFFPLIFCKFLKTSVQQMFFKMQQNM